MERLCQVSHSQRRHREMWIVWLYLHGNSELDCRAFYYEENCACHSCGADMVFSKIKVQTKKQTDKCLTALNCMHLYGWLCIIIWCSVHVSCEYSQKMPGVCAIAEHFSPFPNSLTFWRDWKTFWVISPLRISDAVSQHIQPNGGDRFVYQ